MPQCAIAGCSNTHRKTRGGSVRYHRFPGDVRVRARWLHACGRRVNNCATARVCSRHFHPGCYERDVQHELLGLPTRCRLRKGAVPLLNLPNATVKREDPKFEDGDGIAVLLAVGLVPTMQTTTRGCGGQPADLNKMHVMDDVREGSDVPGAQPSSPGHAEQRSNESESNISPKSQIKNGNCLAKPPSPVAIDENSANETVKDEPIVHIKVEEDEETAESTSADCKPSQSEIESMIEKEVVMENDSNSTNDDGGSNDSNVVEENRGKRKSEALESPLKRMRSQLQHNFLLRDNILNECANSSGHTDVQLQNSIEQVRSEIRTLNELAAEKEREWNNIIHLRCIKDELLLRLQRRQQVVLLGTDRNAWNNIEALDPDADDDRIKLSNDANNPSLLRTNMTGPHSNSMLIVSAQKHKGPSSTTKLNGKRSLNAAHRSLPYANVEINGQSSDMKQNRQRPVIDVQSIIADYRQRHPETVPRRGRRIRSLLHSKGDNKMKSLLKTVSSQVGYKATGAIDTNNELNYLLSAMDGGKKSGPTSIGMDALSGMDASSFKDVLFHIARLSQSERQDLQKTASKPPPPYSEVTVHPVPVTTQALSNSLLHGILTKSNSKMDTSNKSTFSPTLARLLTAPERAASSSPLTAMSHNQSPRNEITITPVGSSQLHASKEKATVRDLNVLPPFKDSSFAKNQEEDEEGEDAADRLIIDEGGEEGHQNRNETGSDGGDEVPQCQGCNQKPAQFVCAGCGNQWYCSRDCQVSAWDEHSEICSG